MGSVVQGSTVSFELEWKAGSTGALVRGQDFMCEEFGLKNPRQRSHHLICVIKRCLRLLSGEQSVRGDQGSGEASEEAHDAVTVILNDSRFNQRLWR